MVDFSGFTRLQALHQRAQRHELRGTELDVYSAVMRDYLAGLLARQNRDLAAHQTPRRFLRFPRVVQLELQTSAASHRVLTLDCGLGGFSAILPARAGKGARLSARLLVGPNDHVTASVRVADERRLRGSARVSFAFVEVADRDLDRLERLIREAAMSRSYWVMAPCEVPIVAFPGQFGASAARDARLHGPDESPFILVVDSDERPRAPAARNPCVVDQRRSRAAAVGTAAAMKRSWW